MTPTREPEPILEPEGPTLVVGEPVAVPRQFDADPQIGCAPIDDTQELIGTIEVVDLGKGDGVILDDGDKKWVVSYGADGMLTEFDGVHVLARGRRCEKHGAAVKASHFDLQSLRVIED